MENTNTNIVSETNSGLSAFMTGVYGWMFGGLTLTAIIAYFFTSSSALMVIAMNPIIFWGIAIAELGLVFYLSARIAKLSSQKATTLFGIYAALNGIFFSTIFILYTGTSIASAFLSTALMFGVLAIYGYTTKRDLTSIGHLALAGLVGIILASLVNIFLGNAGINAAINYLGIIVFLALTAYDNQKIKAMYLGYAGDQETLKKLAILGALTLYLDFINLFLDLLNIFGSRK